MTTKLSVTLVTLSMIATALIGVAAALPPYIPPGGDGHIGPNVNNDCALGQEYGFGGGPGGSGTGYHRYINDNVGLLLDACFNAAGIVPFAGCVVTTASSDLGNATTTILGNPSVDGVEDGVEDATAGASSLYQTPCGGLGGTGTDGEFEYGSTAAALNVRRGAAPEGGDGVDGCLGDIATAHHASDTTIFVQDVLLGGSVAFSVSADWARGNDNTAAGEAHCGDGAIELCETTEEDGIQEHLTDADTGAVLGDVGDITSNLPTSSSNLNHDLDVVNGCNPLDARAAAEPQPPGVALNWLNPPGATLADFGNGGATGWLTVIINTGSQLSACYDLAGECDEEEIDTGTGELGLEGVTDFSAPTLGWIWTGGNEPGEDDFTGCGEENGGFEIIGGEHLNDGAGFSILDDEDEGADVNAAAGLNDVTCAGANVKIDPGVSAGSCTPSGAGGKSPPWACSATGAWTEPSGAPPGWPCGPGQVFIGTITWTDTASPGDLYPFDATDAGQTFTGVCVG